MTRSLVISRSRLVRLGWVVSFALYGWAQIFDRVLQRLDLSFQLTNINATFSKSHDL
jgi:hypothetical protein